MKTIKLSTTQAGRTVLETLQSQLRLPRELALNFVREHLVRVDGEPCQDPRQILRNGQHLQVAPRERGKAPPVSERQIIRSSHSKKGREQQPEDTAKIVIRYVDQHILVVDKPAGLTTVRHKDEAKEMGKRGKEFLPPTLVDLLPRILPAHQRKGRIRAVHRLDKETSGLVVLARTQEAERHLGLQFRAHSVERRYVAWARGEARDAQIESSLVRDRGDGRRGSGPDGERAATHVKVLKRVKEFSLVECILETGRTHQVRIHLGEAGMPLCGERIYDRPLHGAPMPDPSCARRPLLHAAFLAFDHPATGERLHFEQPMPEDMQRFVEKTRRRK